MLQSTIATSLTMNKDHMEQLLEARPFLRNHIPERILTCLLIKGFLWKDTESGLPILPHQLLAMTQGRTEKHSQGKKLIESMQEHVLPGLNVKGYFHQKNQCRSIEEDGLEPWMRDMLFVPPQNQINVQTLKPIKHYAEEAQWRLYKKLAQEQNWQHPTQKFVADTLHSERIKYFLDIREKHYAEAWGIAQGRNDRGSQIRVMHEVHHIPQPYYYNVGSSRLFGTAHQYMAKDIRKVYFQDGYEIDMQNCQLAILAGRFNIPGVKARLQDGTPIWPELLSYMQFEEDQYELAKPSLKEALYSGAYGMRRNYVEKRLEGNLEKDDLEKQAKFISHPLIAEMLDALKRAKRKIKRDGGMMSAFGWHALQPKEDINSFLAHVIQSYELTIISAVYEVAAREQETNHQTFHILLHQHDGLTIIPVPGVPIEQIITKLQNAVMRKAGLFNIPTTIIL